MAKSNTVSDPYVDYIQSQINEIDEQIRASNKKLFDKKSELENALQNYKAFKKKQSS